MEALTAAQLNWFIFTGFEGIFDWSHWGHGESFLWSSIVDNVFVDNTFAHF